MMYKQKPSLAPTLFALYTVFLFSILIAIVAYLSTSYEHSTNRHLRTSLPTLENSISETFSRAPQNHFANQVVTVQSGDTFSSILERLNLDPTQISLIVEALTSQFNPQKLSIGQKINLTLDTKTNELTSLSIKLEPHKEIFLELNEAHGYVASLKESTLQPYVSRIGGTISSSLMSAGHNLNIPTSIMLEVAKAYSYDIDFQRDIQAGDTFEVLFERYYTREGDYAKDGDLLFASLTISGRKINLYRFKTHTNQVGFFTEEGQNVRKDLLRTPLNIFHITSQFGMRRHPVLGYSKMHKGVDFAAPIGTPIFAAGSGVIEEMGRKGAYGNYIRIRHNANYATAYGHISRFSRELKRGMNVKQGEVIAYVGSTGRSTGPHLHYEVLVNNHQTDPLKIKLTSAIKLAGKDLEKFNFHKKRIASLRANTPYHSELALSLNTESE